MPLVNLGEHIKELLKKRTQNTITADEETELWQWLNTTKDFSVLKEFLINELNENVLDEDVMHWDIEQFNQKLTQRIHDDTIVQNKKTKIVSLFKYAAVAVVLAAVIGTAFFYIQDNKSVPNAFSRNNQNNKPQSILPGSNKATLQLAGGSVINLDSASNGQLTIQAGTIVSKTGEGKLLYQSAKETTSTILYNTITTPRGGQYQLTLPDGTSVWLNAASSLTFPVAFTGGSREVEITGEVYFEVAHNPSLPFLVKNKQRNVTVKVLGTHFNVNAYDDENDIKVSLVEGKVAIAKDGYAANLQPGQQAQVASAIKIVSDVDMDEVLAWQKAGFQFSSTSLEEILKQIARWYDVNIIYEGKMPERKFGGKLKRSDSFSEFLKILSANKVKFSLEGKNLIIKN